MAFGIESDITNCFFPLASCLSVYVLIFVCAKPLFPHCIKHLVNKEEIAANRHPLMLVIT